ncbi:MAG TPA: lantibiotic dehydratase [Ktedonobacteraceae bacterium]
MNQHLIDLQATQDSGERAHSWHLMKYFVLRGTGFPFDWLTSLRFSASVVIARQFLHTQAHQKQLQQRFEEELFPTLCAEETEAGRDKEAFRFWYKLARTIRRGQPPDPAVIAAVREDHGRPLLADWLVGWQSTCLELSQLQEEGERTFQGELEERRRTLYDLVGAASTQEALWLSNPSIYEVGWHYYRRHWDPHHRPFKIKHLERRFYTYLQRFCAKNDTTSFFGPLNYGVFEGETGFRSCRSADRIRQRHVFFAYWAIVELARSVAREPELRPYLCPGHVFLRPRPVEDQDLYALCDGSRRVVELAGLLGLSLAETLAAVERLVAAGYLRLDLPIPAAILDPLDYLIQQLGTLPADCEAQRRWLVILTWFQHSCQRFSEADLSQRQAILADLEARYTELTESEARRGQGKMFQDRILLYEECLGNLVELRLSEQHHQKMSEALTPIAALGATYSQLALADLHARANRLFDECSADGRSIPFIRFLSAWRRRYSEPAPSPAAEQLQQRFADLVAWRSTAHTCALSAADLAPLCQPLAQPVVLSPDVLLAASDGEAVDQGRYQVVLGEIHHGVQPVGWMLTFVDNPGAWESEIARCLPAPTDALMPTNLLFGRHMKTAPPEFAGQSLQVSSVSTRPGQPELSQLVVERQGEELLLRRPGDPRALCFYPPSYSVPEPLYAPFACFSYPLVRQVPVRLGEHTPRIEIQGVVYQRERWEVPSSAIPGGHAQGTSFQLFIDMLEFQQRLGLPDHVFISMPTEPKPIYIDFHNYFALELLAHLVGQTETITFVEMWPDPEHLWLGDKATGRYCCELRTVLSSAPGNGWPFSLAESEEG